MSLQINLNLNLHIDLNVQVKSYTAFKSFNACPKRSPIRVFLPLNPNERAPKETNTKNCYGAEQVLVFFWFGSTMTNLARHPSLRPFSSSRYVMPMWSLYHWWQHIESPLTNCPKRISWAMVPCWRCRNIHTNWFIYIYTIFVHTIKTYVYTYIVFE